MSNYYSLEAVIVKSRAISVTGSAGLYGCEMFRISNCLDSRLTDDGEVLISV
jgi:hypothetical protein